MRNGLLLKSSTGSQAQVSISNDHTLKSWMKGNFHVQFGIGGGESDLSADHTKTNVEDWLRRISNEGCSRLSHKKASYQRFRPSNTVKNDSYQQRCASALQAN
jgi:hypothetical protein